MMECDVLRYELWEDIEKILYALEKCRIIGDRDLVIFHGY